MYGQRVGTKVVRNARHNQPELRRTAGRSIGMPSSQLSLGSRTEPAGRESTTMARKAGHWVSELQKDTVSSFRQPQPGSGGRGNSMQSDRSASGAKHWVSEPQQNAASSIGRASTGCGAARKSMRSACD